MKIYGGGTPFKGTVKIFGSNTPQKPYGIVTVTKPTVVMRPVVSYDSAPERGNEDSLPMQRDEAVERTPCC